MPRSLQEKPSPRRRFLTTGAFAAAAVALYPSEIERHWIEVSHREVPVAGLHPAFDGLRVVQLSDIHCGEFTEPFFLRRVVGCVNRLDPDLVLLTGDFVTKAPLSDRVFKDAAWACATILNELKCQQRYACLGNHDFMVGKEKVAAALKAFGIVVIGNGCLPVERGGGRFWLSGLEDPSEGNPDPAAAIPPSIRNRPHEPIVLLCHGPDYADNLLARPEGQAVALMLSGHTHGGQVRLPLLGAQFLPEWGRKYVRGWFRLGKMQLHVNRGIGAIHVPFRFNCPPEITCITLRAEPSQAIAIPQFRYSANDALQPASPQARVSVEGASSLMRDAWVGAKALDRPMARSGGLARTAARRNDSWIAGMPV